MKKGSVFRNIGYNNTYSSPCLINLAFFLIWISNIAADQIPHQDPLLSFCNVRLLLTFFTFEIRLSTSGYFVLQHQPSLILFDLCKKNPKRIPIWHKAFRTTRFSFLIHGITWQIGHTPCDICSKNSVAHAFLELSAFHYTVSPPNYNETTLSQGSSVSVCFWPVELMKLFTFWAALLCIVKVLGKCA